MENTKAFGPLKISSIQEILPLLEQIVKTGNAHLIQRAQNQTVLQDAVRGVILTALLADFSHLLHSQSAVAANHHRLGILQLFDDVSNSCHLLRLHLMHLAHFLHLLNGLGVKENPCNRCKG